MTRIIIGIGNPGPEYENTYHNIGILAVGAIAKEYASSMPDATSVWKPYKKLFEYRTERARGALVFARSLLYMNESGRAVRAAALFFKAKPDEIAVVHDDSDLAVGKWKLAASGRSAGHKGVQSAIDQLGTPDFTRIRIGVRAIEEKKRKKAGDFVLSRIKKKDEKKFAEVFGEIRESLLRERH